MFIVRTAAFIHPPDVLAFRSGLPRPRTTFSRAVRLLAPNTTNIYQDQGGSFTAGTNVILQPGGSLSVQDAYSGIAADSTSHQTIGKGSSWTRVTVPDPSDVFTFWITATTTSARSGATGTTNVAGWANVLVEGSAGQSIGYGSAGNPSMVAQFDGQTHTYTTGFMWNVLGGNSFTYNLNGYVEITNQNWNRSSPASGSATGSLLISDVTITLRNANGMDVTDAHTLMFDPDPVIATPEPATLTLFITGLGAIVIVRRRKGKGCRTHDSSGRTCHFVRN